MSETYTVIKSSGSAFDLTDTGRVTSWMDANDPILASWFGYFVGKGIACAIGRRAHGQLAVFRPVGDVKEIPPDTDGSKHLHEKVKEQQ